MEPCGQCEICGNPIFNANGRRPKTCSPECNTARRKAYQKACYDAERDKAIQRVREWRLANLERVKEDGRRRREANKDAIREKKRAYVLTNLEKESARKKAWYQANRDRILAERVIRQTPEMRAEAARKTRAWSALNPDRKKATRDEWYRANPERATAAHLRRRARKLSVPADDVPLSVLLADQGSACYLCGEPINDAILHPDPMSGSIDHVIPLVRGGTGLRDNLRAAHLVCNLRKGTKLLDELAAG